MRPLLALVAAFSVLPCSAWGQKGHRINAGLALQALPAEVKPWFLGQEDFVRDHSSDPDHWRQDRKEPPRHFIDSETYGGVDKVPKEVEAAIAQVGQAAFLKAGQVPWVIQDRLRELAQAFQMKDRQQVAFLSSILSHYVADLHVPLHSTRNYNGQMSGNQGVHSRWETGLVERFVVEEELKVVMPPLEKGLFTAPWEWMKAANARIPALLEHDREADRTSPESLKGKRREGAYWLTFWNREGEAVKAQLIQSAQHTAQLITYAWVLGGKPSLPEPKGSTQTTPEKP